MRETPNLSLKLPDLTDYVNIEDINGNMEVIDTELSRINSASSGTETKLNTHSAQNASKTQKGHMQVGYGLEVTNGVVSANYHVDNTKTLDSLPSDFLVGETLTIVATSQSGDALYNQCRTLLNDLMQYTLPDNSVAFRFAMHTIKRSNTLIKQSIIVTRNAANGAFVCFEVTREANYSTNEWLPWFVNPIIFNNNGNPNGVVTGMKGMLCYDFVNGVLYKKTTSTSTTNYNGWVPTSEIALNDTLHAPGNTIIHEDRTVSNSSTTTPVEAKSVKINKKGVYRVTFNLSSTAGSFVANGQLFVNGTAVGELKQNSSNPIISYTQDISIPKGAILSLRIYNSGTQGNTVTNNLFTVSVEGDVN